VTMLGPNIDAYGRDTMPKRRFSDLLSGKFGEVFTVDVIVGFLGATEEDFKDTLSLIEEIIFDLVNTAAYSPRPNTPTATWMNQVPDEIKSNILRRINVLVKEDAKERRLRMLDKTVEVLVEERNFKVPTQVTG